MTGPAAAGAVRLAAPPVKPFPLSVTAVRDLGPRLRRITFGGTSLLGFATDGGAAWDLRIKIVIPQPGRSLPRAQAFKCHESEDPARSWRRAGLRLPEAERGELRSYTVREARLDEAYPEIDVDFLLHPHGPQGPAARWARSVQLGDPALIIGPSASAGQCAGIEFAPGRARHVLLAGDETALPAITGILRDLPAGFRAEAVIEVPDAAMIQDLPTRAAATVTWLERRRNAHGAQLAEAVRRAVPAPLCAPGPAVVDRVVCAAAPLDVGPERDLLWDTPQYRRLFTAPADGPEWGGAPFYAWIAGESTMVTGLRRYLVRECGLHREQVAFMGYWKKDTP